MADFGLAAQIGRGAGGGAGGIQRIDPANRMMQMMQLQQAQQNMMLQQELAGRQRQLFPLQLRQAEQDVELSGLRSGLVREQTGTAREARLAAERAGSAETGALDYISRFSGQERLNPKNLDELRRARPGSYKIIADQISKARELKAKAQKEGFSAEKARIEMRNAALSGMSSLLPAVTDQNKYAVLYDDFRRIDPDGAKLIGPEYTPANVKALQLRIRDLSELEYKEDAFGRPYQRNKRTGEATLLGGDQAPAQPASADVSGGGAAVTPAAPAIGTQGLVAVQPAMPMSPDVAQRAIAGAAIPSETPGPAPIIGQRQPVAPQPSVAAQPSVGGPAAAAEFEKVRAREQAKAQVARTEKDVEKRAARESVQDTIDGMVGAYKRLAELNALQTKDMSLAQRAAIVGRSRLPTDVATAISPEIGAELTAMSNLRQSLIPVLTELMGARSVDAVKEMEAMVSSLTSGCEAPSAIARTLNNFSKKYGLGISIDAKDLTPAAPSRQSASPVSAATGRTPAIGTVEDGYRFKGGDPRVSSNWEKM